MPLARVNTTHAQVRIAVVGEGTGDVLRGAPDAVQLDIAFTPTKARHVQDALVQPCHALLYVCRGCQHAMQRDKFHGHAAAS